MGCLNAKFFQLTISYRLDHHLFLLFLFLHAYSHAVPLTARPSTAQVPTTHRLAMGGYDHSISVPLAGVQLCFHGIPDQLFRHQSGYL